MALCLPRRRRATSLATRPRTLSVASITNHSCVTSAGLALKVFMISGDRVELHDVVAAPREAPLLESADSHLAPPADAGAFRGANCGKPVSLADDGPGICTA